MQPRPSGRVLGHPSHPPSSTSTKLASLSHRMHDPLASAINGRKSNCGSVRSHAHTLPRARRPVLVPALEPGARYPSSSSPSSYYSSASSYTYSSPAAAAAAAATSTPSAAMSTPSWSYNSASGRDPSVPPTTSYQPKSNGFLSKNQAAGSPSNQFNQPSTSLGPRSPYLVSSLSRMPAKTVAVQFCVKHSTNWGESIKIIGSHANLGNWSVLSAPELMYTPGDQWTVTVELPPGIIEYKYVVVDYNTKQPVHWQAGGNAVLALEPDERGPVEVVDNWSNAPGASIKQSDGLLTTREDKLRNWGNHMLAYYDEAQETRGELARTKAENQALRHELVEVKMELSFLQRDREEGKIKLAELQQDNLRLQMEVTATRMEMNNTLSEALKMLTEEMDRNEDLDDDDWEEGDDHDDVEEEVEEAEVEEEELGNPRGSDNLTSSRSPYSPEPVASDRAREIEEFLQRTSKW